MIHETFMIHRSTSSTWNGHMLPRQHVWRCAYLYDPCGVAAYTAISGLPGSLPRMRKQSHADSKKPKVGLSQRHCDGLVASSTLYPRRRYGGTDDFCLPGIARVQAIRA